MIKLENILTKLKLLNFYVCNKTTLVNQVHLIYALPYVREKKLSKKCCSN